MKSLPAVVSLMRTLRSNPFDHKAPMLSIKKIYKTFFFQYWLPLIPTLNKAPLLISV